MKTIIISLIVGFLNINQTSIPNEEINTLETVKTYTEAEYYENIEFCGNIIHNPLMQDVFNEQCDEEMTNKYILNVKLGNLDF